MQFKLIALLILIFNITNINSQTDVGGLISADETWSKAGTPHTVTSPLLVNSGVTLTIESGVIVEIPDPNYIRVDGILIVNGTETDTVTFSPMGEGINITSSAISYDSINGTGCQIKYAKFIAQPGNKGLTNNQTGVLVTNSVFKETGYSLGHGLTYFEDNRVIDASITSGRFNKIRGNYFQNGSFNPLSSEEIGHNVFDKCQMYQDSGMNQFIHHNYFFETHFVLRSSVRYFNNTSYSTSIQIREYEPGPGLNQNNNYVGTVPEFSYKMQTLINTDPFFPETYDASANYWGTADLEDIGTAIYDNNDDADLEIIGIDPVLTTPDEDAPAFIHYVEFTPDDTLSSGSISMAINFSKPMDTSLEPVASFGTTEPYDSFQFGSGSWSNGNKTFNVSYPDVTALPPDSALYIKVSNAKGSGDYHSMPAVTLSSAFVRLGPASIQMVEVLPNDTIIDQPITLIVHFDKKMNTGNTPAVSFGEESPFNEFLFGTGTWSTNDSRYESTYSDIENLNSDVLYSVKISGAKGLNDPDVIPDKVFSDVFVKLSETEVTMVSYSPNDTVENEGLTIDIVFSKNMDTDFIPILTFGGIEPYDDYSFPDGEWSNEDTEYQTTFTEISGIPPFVPYHVVLSNAKAEAESSPLDAQTLSNTFIRMVPYPDTTYTIISDTVTTEILDTTYIIVHDTITHDVYDTTFLTHHDTISHEISDTSYVVHIDSISVTDTLYIDAVLTGVDPPDNVYRIKVYPNPARDHIHFDIVDYILLYGHRIKITNQLGQPVYDKVILDPMYIVNLSSWSGKGLYFIQLLDPDGIVLETRKIILE